MLPKCLIKKKKKKELPKHTDMEINHWFLVVWPYLIAAVVVWFIYRCCCGGGGGNGKMMKAPGRNYRMPRNAFESDPKAYFSDLRK
ncbi:hypothetical protein BUALT_Bualt17G0084900 [Buddleja alternifolia]|uniref:ATP synthase F0 subunit 8 n=1 Tax=Buddleja alternifolia TaxID=168488 RepID=A0AAV6WCJ6_9LAMI|nr:hypothetical protein BUALT_Bualt17G0084900 [Buddleja alternifolia]